MPNNALERAHHVAANYSALRANLQTQLAGPVATLGYDAKTSTFNRVSTHVARPSWLTRTAARVGLRPAKAAVARYAALCEQGKAARRALAEAVQAKVGPQVLALATQGARSCQPHPARTPLRERLTEVFVEDARIRRQGRTDEAPDRAESTIEAFVMQDKPLTTTDAWSLTELANGWATQFRDVNEAYLKNNSRFSDPEFLAFVKVALPAFEEQFFVDVENDDGMVLQPAMLDEAFRRFNLVRTELDRADVGGPPDGVARLEFIAEVCDLEGMADSKPSGDWSFDRRFAAAQRSADAEPVPKSPAGPDEIARAAQSAANRTQDRRDQQVNALVAYVRAQGPKLQELLRRERPAGFSDQVVATAARHVLSRRIPAPFPAAVSPDKHVGFQAEGPRMAVAVARLCVTLARSGADDAAIVRGLKSLAETPEAPNLASVYDVNTGWRPGRAPVEPEGESPNEMLQRRNAAEVAMLVGALNVDAVAQGRA
jgi:hypothetical protein